LTSVIVDASVALSWCFDDEASPETDAVLDQVRRHGAVVPGLWHLEIANVLLQAERRGRNIQGGVVARMGLLTQLPVAIDPETVARAGREILTLARAEQLTAYDAAYLELALRCGLPLASKDEALIQAARRLGVSVLP